MCRWCVPSEFSDHLISGLSSSRRKFMLFTGALAATAYGTGLSAQPISRADIIFRNGSIYPMTQQSGKVEALAVRGSQILATGSVDEVMRLAGSSTQVVDLAGRTL